MTIAPMTGVQPV